MKHSFEIYWIEDDEVVHECDRCGLEIHNPRDEYECGLLIKSMDDEWLNYCGYGTDCDLRIVESVMTD